MDINKRYGMGTVEEFTVVGYEMGTGRCFGELGCLYIKTGPGLVDTTPVALGFSNEQRTTLWAIKDQLAGKKVRVMHAGRHTSANGAQTLVMPVFKGLVEGEDI